MPPIRPACHSENDRSPVVSGVHSQRLTPESPAVARAVAPGPCRPCTVWLLSKNTPPLCGSSDVAMTRLPSREPGVAGVVLLQPLPSVMSD